MQKIVIEAIAQALESATPEILAATYDCQAAAAGIPKPLYNRLKLDEMKQGCDRRSECEM